MAKEHSFDISAKMDIQRFKNAINLAEHGVADRYDFKATPYAIDFHEKHKLLLLTASSDNKLEALEDIVIAKLLKQGLSSKVLEKLRIENASGNTRKATFKIVDYIDAKEAKRIVSEIKKLKLRVTATIEGDSIRVKGRQIDDLQKVMRQIKSMEWDAPLVYNNMR